MDNIDGAIRALREDIARLGTLRTRLQSLYAQRDELAAREAELAEIAEDEADDVRRLEGRSLARYFFGLHRQPGRPPGPRTGRGPRGRRAP